MNTLAYKLPTTPARRGYFGLGVASLLFALAFLPAPLAVLYQLNEECLAAASWGTSHATWDTLHRIPPSPVSRSLDLTVRAAVVGALVATLFLLAAAVATFRSRTAALRLHALYVPLQVVLMVTLIVAAHRFSAALDLSSSQRDWALRVVGASAVRKLAIVVAALGLLYPLVLALLYWRYPGGDRSRRE